MAKEKKNSFIKWLEILQQESWQLELLISGFAIFLLASGYDQIDGFEYKIRLLTSGSEYFGSLLLPFKIILGAWYVLVINLILHVLLRGLWISTIGIRYVSGEIEFDVLKLSPKFDRFLKKRIVSFDSYIEKLEQLCSIVFGFTFLIIFILLSFGIYLAGIIIIAFSMDMITENNQPGWLMLFIPLLIFYIFGGLIYFIDFITLGWIKKRKSISGMYYPIYRFFSFVTLSFVYRPLYYNLIDNKYGRKVVLFLFPYALILILISTMTIQTQAFLPNLRFNETLGNNRYDDTWNGTTLINSASLQSKFVDNGYLELYLPYVGRTDDNVIKLLCPDLEPAKKGIFFLSNGDEKRNSMNAEMALDCHSQRFKIYVNDSLLSDLKYRFYDHPKRKNQGLATIFDVNFLNRGEHLLKIEVLFARSVKGKDTLIFSETDNIPFWKE